LVEKMKETDLRSLLSSFKEGTQSIDDLLDALSGRQELGFAVVDTGRQERTGHPEAIFGEGKSAAQILGIAQALKSKAQTVLVTRLSQAKAEELQKSLPEFLYNPTAKCMLWRADNDWASEGEIGILCAGTSDIGVAEETMVTLRSQGHQPTLYADVGVAGLHRLLSRIDKIRSHRALVVIAGMEGALASVVAGLVKAPVIAVPTSVGYGSNLGGITALLGMLNSCSPGIAVVNIDNGYGAAMAASRILEA
jgi:pyridinium-3,5-biscarboxylic acid mononucleotide synthase